MKFVSVTILGCLVANFAWATDFGKELSIRVDQGKAHFGSQFAYDTDTAWVVTYTTTITNAELSVLPPTIKWNVFNTKSGTYLNKWQDTQREGLMVGSLGVDDKAILPGLLANLKTLVVAYGVVNHGTITPVYFLDTGKLCQTLPDHYLNLTLGKTGCDLK